MNDQARLPNPAAPSVDRVSRSAKVGWSLDDIDYRAIDTARLRRDSELFYVLAASSFIESGSHTYASNLATYYAGTPAAAWLAEQWEREELQHGEALRRFVEHVWPEFAWERGFVRFFEEYYQYCAIEAFERSRALELLTRCVVETTTAALYRSLERFSDEPVFCSLMRRIADDEVRHYKHFYRYFRDFNAEERVGRIRMLGALARRLTKARALDGDVALRNVLRVERGVEDIPQEELEALGSRLLARVRRHLPLEMTIRMLLRPLRLHAGLERVIRRPLAAVLTRPLV